jgi:Ca2+-binding EF-hand superfamily protein
METSEDMSMKPFYIIGAAVVAISATAAVTVFAADTTTSKASAVSAPVGKAAPKGDRRIVHLEAPTFAEIDANHDGSISQAEFDAFHAAHKPGLREGELHAGMMEPPMFMRMNRHFGGHDEGFGGMAHGERALDLLDTNNDGKLSFDELIAPMKRHFERQDTNHDGVLSADEMEKGHDRFERRLPPPPEGQ